MGGIPVWLQYIVAAGGVSGIVALIGAAAGFGRVLQKVSDLDTKVGAIPGMEKDIAYIRGRLDGRQEGLDEVSARRRPRVAAVSG